MGIKRLIVIALLLSAVGFFWVQIFLTVRESKVLASKNEDVTQKLAEMYAEKDKISQDIAYYSNPLNLAKLLKEKFNFKEPSEKMIIVVPQ
jgi:hypothetical protein